MGDRLLCRVLLGVGDGEGFELSTAEGTRPEFIKNVLDYLEAHDYDGFDMDWEDNLNKPENIDALIAFLKEIKAASLARDRYKTKPLLITFPSYVLNTNFDVVNPKQVEIAQLVDQYNLMSYANAFFGAGWDTWVFCAIKGQEPTHPMDLSSSVRMYVDAGIPRSKIGIGIGFYGMNYGPPFTGPRQPTNGHAFSLWSTDEGTWNYARLSQRGYLTSGEYHWDEASQTSYRVYSGGFTPMGGGATAGYLSYEDPASIAAKGAWVRSEQLDEGAGGTIIWLVNYGTTDGKNNPLMDAVKQAFLQ